VLRIGGKGEAGHLDLIAAVDGESIVIVDGVLVHASEDVLLSVVSSICYNNIRAAHARDTYCTFIAGALA